MALFLGYTSCTAVEWGTVRVKMYRKLSSPILRYFLQNQAEEMLQHTHKVKHQISTQMPSTPSLGTSSRVRQQMCQETLTEAKSSSTWSSPHKHSMIDSKEGKNKQCGSFKRHALVIDKVACNVPCNVRSPTHAGQHTGAGTIKRCHDVFVLQDAAEFVQQRQAAA